MEKIGILVGAKGRGSNMEALIRAAEAGEFPGQIAVVAAPSAESPALERARSLGVPTAVAATEDELVDAFREVAWICLTGYLRLLPPAVRGRWAGHILNIHPSLLPRHGGKGMYGMHVHRAVLASGDLESGCTVHHVNEVYDDGEVVCQLRCAVDRDDTAESLAARVLALEHRAYPEALRRVLAQ